MQTLSIVSSVALLGFVYQVLGFTDLLIISAASTIILGGLIVYLYKKRQHAARFRRLYIEDLVLKA